jgi:hypothetical protein
MRNYDTLPPADDLNALADAAYYVDPDFDDEPLLFMSRSAGYFPAPAILLQKEW